MDNETTAEVERPLGTLITGGPHPTISLLLGGKPYIIAESFPNFQVIHDKLMNEDYEGLKGLLSIEEKVKEELEAHGITEEDGVVVRNGEAFLNGNRLGGVLAQRLVERAERGFSLTALSNFAAKLYQNPSRTSVQELYLFLESANMPICEDGDFLAYKVIRDNYFDCHSGTINNAPGEIIEMPRYEVDDNRNSLCSYGLHFCSYAYLPTMFGYRGSRVVVVKINPADVVSVPADYANTKGRCCRYEVISELESWNEPKLEGTCGNRWLTNDEDVDYDDEDDEDEFEQMLEDEFDDDEDEPDFTWVDVYGNRY